MNDSNEDQQKPKLPPATKDKSGNGSSPPVTFSVNTTTGTSTSTATTRPVASTSKSFRHAPSRKHNATSKAGDRQRVQEEREQWGIHKSIILPWSPQYKCWWYLTVGGALLTIFTETYNVAFSKGGLYPYNDASSIIEYLLVSIFFIDIFVNFRLAYYDDEQGHYILDGTLIARNYVSYTFWIDVIGVFPFYAVLLAMFNQLGQDTKLSQFLALVRLVRMVRLRRMQLVFEILQYNPNISLMWLTLTRNFCFALVWSHFAACVMYFIARQYDFDPDQTWIGGSLEGLNGRERYLTSLYWSVTTFTTVGYGDFSPVNSVEQVWGMMYMLSNIILQAWVIGSITLLIVRSDEKTGLYRESLQTLNHFAAINGFDKRLQKSLKTQLRLEFENKELADEQVLQHFPSSTRRKVLRKLYLPHLIRTNLMKDIRQQFVDAFLSACTVEMFSPGEELLTRGSVSSDLYLLVEGVVKVMPWGSDNKEVLAESTFDDKSNYGTSIADSENASSGVGGGKRGLIFAGEFINEICFFTESPQIDTIRTKTICKTLTMSRSAYSQICEDHPGSVGHILHNLLEKAEELADEFVTTGTEGGNEDANDDTLPKRISLLRAGSSFIPDSEHGSYNADLRRSTMQVRSKAAVTAIRDLVKMHMNKLKDDHTTRFLFAASRNDLSTVTCMADNGFDCNSSDYDFRTALMVSAMKGHTETVSKILEYQANPNLVDVHGTSALYEAARNGYDDTMRVLLEHGAKLCMTEGKAASVLCQAVFDGDILQLGRLLKAQIQVNAGDYDGRTAAHIAAAEGNVAALRLLVEYGADLTLKDRWHNSVIDEAKREGDKNKIMDYLDTLQ